MDDAQESSNEGVDMSNTTEMEKKDSGVDVRGLTTNDIVKVKGIDGGPLLVQDTYVFDDMIFVALVDSERGKIGITSPIDDLNVEKLPAGTSLGPCGVCTP